MSKRFDKLKNNLKEISELMDEVVENWEHLSDDEFYKLAEEYPEYLPSFDEFNSDFQDWVKSLSEKEN